MGWSDVDGIDELRIGTFSGTNNVLWFDDLEMQITAEPESGTLTLIGLGLGLVDMGITRRKKKV